MRKLSKAIFFFLCAQCVDSAIALGASPAEATPDGRYGTHCYWKALKQGDLCQVSFYSVLAAPEKYDGHHIMLTGFLITISHQLVLFASRQSYESGVEGEGVALDVAKLSSDLKKRVDRGAWPVTVVGTFDAKFSGIGRPRLGALRKVDNVVLNPRLKF